MSRSKWKGPIINTQNIKLNEKKSSLIVLKRNCKITPRTLTNTFQVYNGKAYTEVNISEEMISHNLGEFVFTRKNFSFPQKKTKK